MKNIKEYVFKLLNDPDSSQRRSAAEELAFADERAVYPLIKALEMKVQQYRSQQLRL
jgi:hypothetical protein